MSTPSCLWLAIWLSMISFWSQSLPALLPHSHWASTKSRVMRSTIGDLQSRNSMIYSPLTLIEVLKTPSILRILFMVPLYSVSMLLSTKFFPYSTYFILLSSTYASVAIASYFSLLCHYLAPDGDSKSLFSNIQPGPWQNYFPLPLRWLHDRFGGEKSFLRTMTCGVTWFNVCSLPFHFLD